MASSFLKGIQLGKVTPAPAGFEYVDVCANLCGADARSAKLQVCALCRVVHYCGKACQTADWKRHKVCT